MQKRYLGCADGAYTYFFAPEGGSGARNPVSHAPLLVLLPVYRPEASRRVVVVVPLPRVLSVPVRRRDTECGCRGSKNYW